MADQSIDSALIDPALIGEVLIDARTLQQRVRELGAQVSADYAGVKDLLLVSVLKGSVLFLTDLMRSMTIPHAIDFMAVTSYGAHARQTTGTVRIDMDLRQNIEGRSILIVEDIVDSGLTLDYICRLLLARHPKSLKICALLNKPSRRRIDLKLDYVGFVIPDKFVFGYGLDWDELYRNLPLVAVVADGKTG
ncbi:MAG: hypoxanthine phosphoribosyltransferase [Aggregatilineales bacterium]